jgi:hypothetical protein
VKRLLSVLLLVCLVVVCGGCGNIFIRGALQPGFSTISGSVGIVQLSTVMGGDGTTVQVTFVTFLLNGTSSTIGFCGDQRGQFPIDQMVRTNFTLGQTCDSIIVVVIIN